MTGVRMTLVRVTGYAIHTLTTNPVVGVLGLNNVWAFEAHSELSV